MMITRANEPCLTIEDIENGSEDCVPYEIASRQEHHRAAVQRRYADELGLEFADVRCHSSFIKIATWAEAWMSSSDRHYQIEDKYNEAGLEGRWITDDYGTRHLVNVHPFYGYAFSDDEIDEMFGQLPEDWSPDYIYGAYSTCKATDEGAIPVWVCTTW